MVEPKLMPIHVKISTNPKKKNLTLKTLNKQENTNKKKILINYTWLKKPGLSGN